MKSKNNNISYRVALGGVVSALCLVSMLIAGIIPALSLTLPMIAGVLLKIVSIEVSPKWAFLTYVAISILALVTVFDKEAVLIFVMFFGHYPIIRIYLQKIKIKLMRIILKFAVFNVCILAFFYLTVYMFGMQQILEDIGELGVHGGRIMLVTANVMFFLYDINLDFCHLIYSKRLRPKLSRK